MKIPTIIILLTTLLSGCKQKVAPVQYPKFVHNTCSGKWAVRTGTANKYSPFAKDVEVDTTYLGQRGCDGSFYTAFHLADDSIVRVSIFDTVETSTTGREAVFTDSLSAVEAWNRYANLKLLQARRDFIRDSTYRADQARKDSIYKCQHTYK